MAANGQSRFDPNFTNHVIETIGPKTGPRERLVLGALIRHIHDFAREVELTVDEWMLGVHFVNSIGQISDSKRNEGQRISDVLGLESCVLPSNPSANPILTISAGWLTKSHTSS